MDLINAEVVGNSSTANPILSFPPNGFITGLASIDTPARWIDHWLYSTYVRSIIFPKLTEFLAEVIAHFNALNIELVRFDFL